MNKDYKKDAKIFKAFCDDNRLQILDILTGGERCACKLLAALNIGQPTLSHHMKILCDSGIVSSRREGKWTHYSINKKGIEKAGLILKDIAAVAPDEKDDCKCL